MECHSVVAAWKTQYKTAQRQELEDGNIRTVIIYKFNVKSLLILWKIN